MEPRILQEACESGVSSGAFFAVLIVMIITLAMWIGFVVNGRYGCLPLVFIRIVNDKSFLAEYERRLDKVVEHDLKKKYHVGRKLGEGVTSQVYRIQERSSSTFFALKKIPLKGSASLQRAVEREIKILKKLRHHHVTTLHDVYQSPNRIWAVLEFVSGGEMTHYISTEVRRQATAAPKPSHKQQKPRSRKPHAAAATHSSLSHCFVNPLCLCAQDAEWDESHAARCAFQVLSALAYLHSQGVCHRDIKLANLLRSSRSANAQMKVADFGAATMMEVPDDCAVSAATSLATGEASPSLMTFKGIQVGKECIGTPCNMAPEVFDRKYGPMCDMWSFGCVLYELLLGEPPFDPYASPLSSLNA